MLFRSTEKLALLPWLVSLVAVGLPHGAADWAVSRRAWGAATLRIGAAYLACMTAVLGLFIAFPTPMVTAFAALSVWHFGMAHADGQEPPISGGAVQTRVPVPSVLPREPQAEGFPRFGGPSKRDRRSRQARIIEFLKLGSLAAGELERAVVTLWA